MPQGRLAPLLLASSSSSRRRRLPPPRAKLPPTGPSLADRAVAEEVTDLLGKGDLDGVAALSRRGCGRRCGETASRSRTACPRSSGRCSKSLGAPVVRSEGASGARRMPARREAVVSLRMVFDAGGAPRGCRDTFPGLPPRSGARRRAPNPAKAREEGGPTVGSGRRALPGTLRSPGSGGSDPFPALVLVSTAPGRRGTATRRSGGTKVFRDLAGASSRRGMRRLPLREADEGARRER